LIRPVNGMNAPFLVNVTLRQWNVLKVSSAAREHRTERQ
jgi:hypothetical protein